MPTIDVKRLAAEVSAKHGIRLDPDDPIMAVITLNQLVFELSVSEVLQRVSSAVREFEQAADKVHVRAGIHLAREVRDTAANLQMEMRKEFEGAGPRKHAESRLVSDARSIVAVLKWFVLGPVSAVAIFFAGVWVGAWLR